MTEAKFTLALRHGLVLDDFASFTESVCKALESAIGCANVRCRIHNVSTKDGSIKAVVSAKLSAGTSECTGLKGLCNHTITMNPGSASDSLVRAIANERSSLYHGPQKRLFEGAVIVSRGDTSQSDNIYTSSAAKIQQTWKRSKVIPAEPQLWKAHVPYPTLGRREEAARCIQLAWRRSKKAIRPVKRPPVLRPIPPPTLAKTLSVNADLVHKLRPEKQMSLDFAFLQRTLNFQGPSRFHATKKGRDAMLSWDRRGARFVGNERHDALVVTDKYCTEYSFSVEAYTKALGPVRVGFTRSTDSAVGGVADWALVTEIPAEMIRTSRSFTVRLVSPMGYIHGDLLYLGIFFDQKLCAVPSRMLHLPSEDGLFGCLDLSGSAAAVRLCLGDSKRLTNEEAWRQIEPVTSVSFIPRGATAPPGEEEVVNNIYKLMREVEENTRRIEGLGMFDNNSVLQPSFEKKSELTMERKSTGRRVKQVAQEVDSVSVLSGSAKVSVKSLAPSQKSAAPAETFDEPESDKLSSVSQSVRRSVKSVTPEPKSPASPESPAGPVARKAKVKKGKAVGKAVKRDGSGDDSGEVAQQKTAEKPVKKIQPKKEKEDSGFWPSIFSFGKSGSSSSGSSLSGWF